MHLSRKQQNIALGYLSACATTLQPSKIHTTDRTRSRAPICCWLYRLVPHQLIDYQSQRYVWLLPRLGRIFVSPALSATHLELQEAVSWQKSAHLPAELQKLLEGTALTCKAQPLNCGSSLIRFCHMSFEGEHL